MTMKSAAPCESSMQVRLPIGFPARYRSNPTNVPSNMAIAMRSSSSTPSMQVTRCIPAEARAGDGHARSNARRHGRMLLPLRPSCERGQWGVPSGGRAVGASSSWWPSASSSMYRLTR